VSGSPTVDSIFSQRIVVGVGDMAVSSSAHATISTYALGSCVGIVAYSGKFKAGGILHIMLPYAKLSPDRATRHPFVFADTGFYEFLRALGGLGLRLENTKIAIAGGASILSSADIFKIGERNVDAVKVILDEHKIRPVFTDIGGFSNRTLHLNLGTGALDIKLPSELKTVSLA